MAPLLGVFSTLFLVASAVAQVRDPIMEAGLGLQLPVLALHLLGGLFGYVVPKTMGFPESIARTMAMEVSPLNEGRRACGEAKSAAIHSIVRLDRTNRLTNRLINHESLIEPSALDPRPSTPQTSMKSSAFGFLLAKLHFETFLTRVPSAVSVVWMAITGSALAVMWKYVPVPVADA